MAAVAFDWYLGNPCCCSCSADARSPILKTKTWHSNGETQREVEGNPTLTWRLGPVSRPLDLDSRD